MKFTPRDGQVNVDISCVLFSSSSPTTIKDKVKLAIDKWRTYKDTATAILVLPFLLFPFQFEPDAVGFFRVEVSDKGVGLSEEEQRNIFGEFTQFNKNELQNGGTRRVHMPHLITVVDDTVILCIGGSGLGLWISRKIVQMHKVRS